MPCAHFAPLRRTGLLPFVANCGYSIEVTSARELATSIVVEVTTTTSSTDCNADASPSFPVAFALLPKSDKPYTFMERSATKQCPKQ